MREYDSKVSTIERGNAGEAAVLNEFVQRGFQVFVPFGNGSAIDLITLVEGAFVRVQCKTGWRNRGCLLFNSYSTDHGRGQGSYEGLADLFGVFYPPTTELFFVPVTAVTASGGRLRMDPTLNNQKRRIRSASDYSTESWTSERLATLAKTGIDQNFRDWQAALAV